MTLTDFVAVFNSETTVSVHPPLGEKWTVISPDATVLDGSIPPTPP